MPAPLKDDAGRTKWIDVWLVEFDDECYITDREPLAIHQRETITKTRMRLDVYELHPLRLPAPPEDCQRAGG